MRRQLGGSDSVVRPGHLRPTHTRTSITLNTRLLSLVEFKVIEPSLNSWLDGWAECKVDHAA
jgi:hypothetical protein